MTKINVSLTTISSRVENIHLVIDSLLNQITNDEFTFEVNLYLSSEPYMLDEGVKELTTELGLLLENENFNVHFVKNIGSYRKFYYSLQAYFDNKESFDFLVTSDDDTLYPDDWLYVLYSKCIEYDCCVSFRGRQAVYENGLQLPYRKWRHGDPTLKEKSLLNVGTGKDGIIYKPTYFHPGVIELDGVLESIGHADDLWLKAHTALKFVPTVIIEPDLSKSFPETKGSGVISLYNKFNRAGGNDDAMKALKNFIMNRYSVDINDFLLFNLKGNSTILKWINYQQ